MVDPKTPAATPEEDADAEFDKAFDEFARWLEYESQYVYPITEHKAVMVWDRATLHNAALEIRKKLEAAGKEHNDHQG